MAKIDTKVNVNISDSALVKTLIELLNKYRNDLPGELLSAIEELADCEAFEIDRAALIAMGYKTCSVYVDGEKINSAVSVNRVLRRISIFGKPDMYPEHAAVVSDTGVTVMEW